MRRDMSDLPTLYGNTWIVVQETTPFLEQTQQNGKLQSFVLRNNFRAFFESFYFELLSG
jgi:hypothetical protein